MFSFKDINIIDEVVAYHIIWTIAKKDVKHFLQENMEGT